MMATLRALPSRVRGFVQRRRLHRRIRETRALLSGNDAWYALDQLGIAGFGTDLLRVDFPPESGTVAAQSRALATSGPLARIFDDALAAARPRLGAVLAHAALASSWPRAFDATRPHLPFSENPFLSRIDMLVLLGVLVTYRPARYVEVGSGMSTRIAHAARTAAQLPMEIVSIDPTPRLEVEALCDRAIRARLEDNVEPVLSHVRTGDVLFFDGSHRCFPGSDVTRFFLEILPRLPDGVLVHIHDIYLPADYPAKLWNRLWSEHYVLAAWLLGGARGIEIFLPCAALMQDPDARRIIAAIPFADEDNGAAGTCSCWLRTTRP